MNIVQKKIEEEQKRQTQAVLPFYRMEDLDSVCSEISLDTFEEYAEYRLKCIDFVFTMDYA